MRHILNRSRFCVALEWQETRKYLRGTRFVFDTAWFACSLRSKKFLLQSYLTERPLNVPLLVRIFRNEAR